MCLLGGGETGEAWPLEAAHQHCSHPFAWPVSPEQKRWSWSLANPFRFKPSLVTFHLCPVGPSPSPNLSFPLCE